MQEEREQFSVVARLVNGLSSAWLAEPPPTFPFLESQCQRAAKSVNFHSARDETPPARLRPNGRRGVVYRGASWDCQTYFGPIFSFFSALSFVAVDGRNERIKRYLGPSSAGGKCEAAPISRSGA